MKSTTFIAVCIAAFALLPSFGYCDQSSEIIGKIEELARLTAGQGDPATAEALAQQIKTNPEGLAEKLIPRLTDQNLSENELSAYVWAIGETRNQGASKDLMQLLAKNRSEQVRLNCVKALATIGGKECGDFLLSRLDNTRDKRERFDLLILLAEMQYEDALPRMEELLRRDSQRSYWETLLIFTKMGDTAIPYLVRRVGDKNRNVRAHAIRILGQTLMAPEAAKPIQAQYWVESDPNVKIAELNALEKIITDLDEHTRFFEKVVSHEKDDRALRFARETLGFINRSTIASAVDRKKVSVESFNQAYSELFVSMGKKGSYEQLSAASSLRDEAKLKDLRSRILKRNSDEALHDCFTVMAIVMMNRWLEGIEPKKTLQPIPEQKDREPSGTKNDPGAFYDRG
jgi:hypothetical protein